MEAETEMPRNEKEQGAEYLYLYGIINKKDAKFKINGLKNNPIDKINFKDITALTSSYPILNPALNDEEAVEHANILKEIAKKNTVVPTSFGTVFENDDVLETVLSSSYLAIKQTLALIEGKIELGVKVIRNQLGEVPNGVASEILESLNKMSVKSVKGNSFSDRLLLNYSFLVEKNKFLKFSNEIAKLEEKHKDLKFLYTGPWPPYSFINIKISAS